MAMGAEPDERGAGPGRYTWGDTTPHDGTAPLNRRLARVHLGAHGRMQTVRPDEQGPVDLRALTVASLDQNPNAMAVVIVAVTGDRRACANGVDPETIDDGSVEEHLQVAAVHRILRPLIAGAQAARLGVHLFAVQANQHPFPGL